MNDGLSFISSSVIITTTRCVSHRLPFPEGSIVILISLEVSSSAFCSLCFDPSPAGPAAGWIGEHAGPLEGIGKACVGFLQLVHFCDQGRVRPEGPGMSRW